MHSVSRRTLLVTRRPEGGRLHTGDQKHNENCTKAPLLVAPILNQVCGVHAEQGVASSGGAVRGGVGVEERPAEGSA
eukprot:8883266-Pyramimonas_sp.AAC.1